MRKRYFSGLFFFSLYCAFCLAYAHAGNSAVIGTSTSDSSAKPEIVDTAQKREDGQAQVTELNLLSHALIEKARTGNSPAHKFRIEARMYRELLRRLMLDNRLLPHNRQLPQNLLLEMVRMSALLHSAADCKTGLVITCPPDLMVQLTSQQARIDQQLEPSPALQE